MDSLEWRLDIIQRILNETGCRAEECEMIVAPMGNPLQDIDKTQVTTIWQQVQEVTHRVTTMVLKWSG